MFCPFCDSQETKVVDSRLVDEGVKVRRRRECLACKERFTTYEISYLEMPRVVKRDGRRCSFSQDKIELFVYKQQSTPVLCVVQH